MKYFTLEWWLASQDLGEDVGRPIDQYKRYYASVKDQLPIRFVEFKELYSLHDATFLSLNLDLERQQAEFRFLVCHLGYRGGGEFISEKEGTLVYSWVKHFRSSEDIKAPLDRPDLDVGDMRSLASRGHGALGYDEIEVISTGLFEHRMLFSSAIEFVVRFADFDFTIDS